MNTTDGFVGLMEEVPHFVGVLFLTFFVVRKKVDEPFLEERPEFLHGVD